MALRSGHVEPDPEVRRYRRFPSAEKPDNAIVVEANWKHNPFFPQVLDEERLLYRRSDPGAYDHVWEGGYATAVSGSYFGDF
jgi:phage terminase large subunit